MIFSGTLSCAYRGLWGWRFCCRWGTGAGWGGTRPRGTLEREGGNGRVKLLATDLEVRSPDRFSNEHVEVWANIFLSLKQTGNYPVTKQTPVHHIGSPDRFSNEHVKVWANIFISWKQTGNYPEHPSTVTKQTPIAYTVIESLTMDETLRLIQVLFLKHHCIKTSIIVVDKKIFSWDFEFLYISRAKCNIK